MRLLIGNGAREHALAERILESKKLEELFWLPAMPPWKDGQQSHRPRPL